ncbi:MAG: IPT/TIG domain-containing protein [Acidiferrobacterales bacterium]
MRSKKKKGEMPGAGTVSSRDHRTVCDLLAQRFVSAALFLILLGSWANTLYASTYVYDANGRLIAVTASNGSGAQYTYDAVGNIQSIQPISAGQLALFTSSPEQGVVGAQVTIQGSGFSATASSDTVKFNGVVATVVSATATQIVATVPNGATTGPVSVTVGTANVISSTNFAVGELPVITGFTPAFGGAGTAVTVAGSGLDPVSGATTIDLGSSNVAISSITDTQAVFAVPAEAESGLIQVTTPFGQATSAADFVVPPSTISASVESSVMLAANGTTQTVDVSTSNEYGVFAFNATAGQWLSVQLSSLTTTPSGGTVSYQVFSPQGVLIASGSVSAASNMSIHLPAISVSGVYLVAFASGSGTVQVSASLKTDTTLAVNGPTLSLATSVPEQSERVLFSATAGQTFALSLSGISTTSAGLTVNIYEPNGTQLQNMTIPGTQTSAVFNLPYLPAGTYSVSIVPNNGATASMQATLVPGVGSTLTPSSGTASFTTTTAGQYAYISFTATAGQNLGFGITGLTFSPTSVTGAAVYVQDSSGNLVSYCYPSNNSGCGLDLSNLAAGTYTVIVEPEGAATMSFQATLTADVSTNLGANTAYNLNLAQPGQEGLLSFSATAGQTFALSLSGISTTSAGLTVNIYEPNGTQLQNMTIPGTQTSAVFNLPYLPAGTYSVSIVPNNGATASMQATLVPGVGSTLTPSSGTASFTTTTAGQYAYISFTATAGQNLGFGITGLTFSPTSVTGAAVYVQDSSGNLVSYCYPSNNSGCGLDLSNLAAGTYTVIVEPEGAATMSFQALLAQDGDLNGDGKVDGADVLLAQRIALGQIAPTPIQLILGDVAPLVNGVPSPNGQIDSADVLLIERKALGLVNY